MLDVIGNGPGPETTALRSIGVRVNVGPVGTEVNRYANIQISVYVRFVSPEALFR